MKAVMYGGGNIGRGFIGALFSASGYEVVFIDIVETVINVLNERHQYPVRIVSNEEYEDIEIKNVSAVNGNDRGAAAQTIADADIMATAVGVNALKYIIPNMAEGIRLRRFRNGGPLNIIICENLMNADQIVGKMLKAELNEEEQEWFDENIGLVEASVGRMVPVQTEEMKDGDPLRVCVERYGYLPVDKAAFKGVVPPIHNMIPFTPFDFYIKRKLYIHNMGHAVCAYLGDILGLKYISQAIDRNDIYIIVRGAMQESAEALTKKYGVPLEDIMKHIEDLLYRFTNAALHDTCKRVGNDPARKLSSQDRLIGAATLALENNITPACISIGAAAGLVRYLSETKEGVQSVEAAAKALKEVSGLEKDSRLAGMILEMYQRILDKENFGKLWRIANRWTAASLKNVI